ncbi:unnamed protein product [Aphanomyces euteiches]
MGMDDSCSGFGDVALALPNEALLLLPNVVAAEPKEVTLSPDAGALEELPNTVLPLAAVEDLPNVVPEEPNVVEGAAPEGPNVVVGAEVFKVEAPKTGGFPALSPSVAKGTDEPNEVVGAEEPNVVVGAEEPNVVVGAEEPNVVDAAEEPKVVGGADEPNAGVDPEAPKVVDDPEPPNVVEGAEEPNVVDAVDEPKPNVVDVEAPNVVDGADEPKVVDGAEEPNVVLDGTAADPNVEVDDEETVLPNVVDGAEGINELEPKVVGAELKEAPNAVVAPNVEVVAPNGAVLEEELPKLGGGAGGIVEPPNDAAPNAGVDVDPNVVDVAPNGAGFVAPNVVDVEVLPSEPPPNEVEGPLPNVVDFPNAGVVDEDPNVVDPSPPVDCPNGADDDMPNPDDEGIDVDPNEEENPPPKGGAAPPLPAAFMVNRPLK